MNCVRFYTFKDRQSLNGYFSFTQSFPPLWGVNSTWCWSDWSPPPPKKKVKKKWRVALVKPCKIQHDYTTWMPVTMLSLHRCASDHCLILYIWFVCPKMQMPIWTINPMSDVENTTIKHGQCITIRMTIWCLKFIGCRAQDYFAFICLWKFGQYSLILLSDYIILTFFFFFFNSLSNIHF